MDEDQESTASPDPEPKGKWVVIPFPDPVTDGLAWHYTDATGLLGITQSNEIWASAPTALNDSSELRYGEAVIKDAWNRESLNDQLPEPCIKFVDDVLDADLTDDMQDNVFILSASLDGDLLNQWQHYARQGGFAVGLNLRGEMAPAVIPDGIVVGTRQGGAPFPGWRRIVYDRSEQDNWAWKMLLHIANCTPGSAETWRQRLDDWPVMRHSCRLTLQTLICQFKHPAFAAEQEVRFVAASSGYEAFERFRITDGGRIVPYVRLAATDYKAPNGLWQASLGGALPIEEIVCGPSADPNVELSVRRLLHATGYSNVQVRSSLVPFR